MRAFRAFSQEDLEDLCGFLSRFDQKREGLLAPHHEYGHRDLPMYLPWMGPRYGFVGHDFPLSVFRGEGMALFLLMRTIQPKIIAECFTGTGCSGAFLAAGAPQAKVVTVDDYSEGGLGPKGFSHAVELRDRLALINLELYQGPPEYLGDVSQGLSVDVYFSDGPYAESPAALSEDAIIIRQDDMSGQDIKRSFSFIGGSHLSVMCQTAEERDVLMGAMSKAFPVERCDV